jgi:hypothetical protein
VLSSQRRNPTPLAATANRRTDTTQSDAAPVWLAVLIPPPSHRPAVAPLRLSERQKVRSLAALVSTALERAEDPSNPISARNDRQ